MKCRHLIQKFVLLLSILCLSLPSQANAPGKKFVSWLQNAMKENQIPGVSIAVIRDYKIDWVMGFGLRNIRTEDPITDTTLFQAGSISKAVTAAAVLKAVEDGKLNLDTNVNNFLDTWKLPENPYIPNEFVTIRQLLSHSGGTNVSGFLGYSKGQSLPGLSDILNVTSKSNSEAIRITSTPGEIFQYSGGGYVILQKTLMDVYHQPFQNIMEKLVLDPLSMTNSTFSQPLPDSKLGQIAAPYQPDYLSVPGGPHTYIAQAAAGLWTTPFDLAKFLISIQSALSGSPYQILSPESAKLMVEPEMDHVGLGFYVNVNKYGEPTRKGRYFMQRGQNEGYRAILIARTSGGFGAIIMTNMSPDGNLVMEGKIKNNWQFIDNIVKHIADMEDWY